MKDRSRLARLAAQHGVNPADLAAFASSGRPPQPPVVVTGRGTTNTPKGASMSTYYTPSVVKLATELGVDLATVTGTAAGGRIRLDDVYSAAGRARPVTPARNDAGPAQRSAFTRPTLMATHRSRFELFRDVTVDEFALNPLIDDLKQALPGVYEAAVRVEPRIPAMFESGGETPLFTTGGFDPALLLRLPWAVRHLAAATESAAEIAEIFERCGSGTAAAVAQAEVLGGGHPGREAYVARVTRWMDGPSAAPRQEVRRIRVAAGGAAEILDGKAKKLNSGWEF